MHSVCKVIHIVGKACAIGVIQFAKQQQNSVCSSSRRCLELPEAA